jgi:putative transcriptional regulator
MATKIGKDILAGMEQALAYVEGGADRNAYGVHVPDEIDVKAIRANLQMTQQEFAARFGFPAATVRDWEQKRFKPEAASRAFLTVIARDPKAVLRALRAEAPKTAPIRKRASA